MDIQANKVARNYAKAFLNFMGNVLTLSHCEMLQKATCEFKQCLDYITLIPTISSHVKKKVLLSWFQALKIPIDITRLLDLLIYHQRLFLFSTIMEQLCVEYYKRNNIVKFCIQSTASLSKEQIDTIHTFLSYKTGKRIRFTFVLEKNLIVGIRLQSDTYLWEYSLRQRLRNIVNVA